MTEAVAEREEALFSQLNRVLPVDVGPAWLQAMRDEALNLVRKRGLPTTKIEAWRYTDLASLGSIPFGAATELKDKEAARRASNLEAASVRLVFCNGYHSEGLSSLEGLPQEVQVRALSQVLREGADGLREHLSKRWADHEEIFYALNLALFSEGALIEVPEGRIVKDPIHLIFLNEAASEPFMIHPRVVIRAGRNSRLSVVESHSGLSEGAYFSNPVTEIVAAENAVVDHYKVQREGPGAFHIGTVESRQERSATVRMGIYTLGGKLVRNDTTAKLGGEGGSAELDGLFLATGDEHVDNFTTIEHAMPHCSSRELYKGILNERARGVFRGRIVVAEGAQKTDSKQTNKNLLLSDDALVNTKPQLEIYADDVKCTHGATIGQMEEEAMFYLRTRGIDKQTARSMLMYAFAGEVVNEIKLKDLRNELGSALFDWLPGGDDLRK